MELDEAHGSEKYIPSPNLLFLPAALGHEMAAWSPHLGRFIHSCHSEFIYVFIYQHSYSFPLAADTSLPGKSKSYSWPHHSPAVCPLWSSLSTSVSGNNSSYLLGGAIRVCQFLTAPLRHVLTAPCSEKHSFSR